MLSRHKMTNCSSGNCSSSTTPSVIRSNTAHLFSEPICYVANFPSENQFSTRWQLMRRLNFRDNQSTKKEERTQSDLRSGGMWSNSHFFWLILMTKACLLPRKFGRQNLYETVGTSPRTWLSQPQPGHPDHYLQHQHHHHLFTSTTSSIASVTSQPQGSLGPSPSSSHSHPHHQQPYPPHHLHISTWEQVAASSLCLNEGSAWVSFPLDPFDNFGWTFFFLIQNFIYFFFKKMQLSFVSKRNYEEYKLWKSQTLNRSLLHKW